MNKKGFTLIELLAVIILLSIIMVISVPKIIDLIEHSQKMAFTNDVKSLIEVAKLEYETRNKDEDILDEETGLPKLPIYEFTSKISDSGKILSTYQTEESINNFGKLVVKGDIPSSGKISIVADIENYVDEGYYKYDEESMSVIVDQLISKNGKWCAKKDRDNDDIEVGKTEEMNCEVSGNNEIIDKNICEVDYNELDDRYEIRSVCDLYTLAYEYKEGSPNITEYNKKGIYLAKNIDMSDTSNIGDYGEEKGKPFIPIGTSSHPFSAKFEGGAHTISNLTINMPGSNNVGIFGYVKGTTIYGLNIDNINVTGKDSVGGLVGYADSYSSSTGGNINIKEIVANNLNVTGTNRVGGLVGYSSNSSYKFQAYNIIIRSETVSATDTGSYVYVGSTVGDYARGEYFIGEFIVEDYSAQKGETSVTFSDESNNNIYHKPEVTNEINFYDSAGLDTWIGGDNDNSGYYFDYEDWTNPKSKIVLKTTKENPITFRLKGEGTQEDPYLISSESDWRDMTTRTATSDVYYKLTNDIDFSDKKFYEMGNYNNKVTGITFEGGTKTISNVTINARKKDYVGIFGYVRNTTIYGLQLDNINVTGYLYVGGLVGYANFNSSTDCVNIKEIVANNLDVTGYSYVGGLVGAAFNSSSSTAFQIYSIIIRSETVSATSTGSYVYVGSVVGLTNYTAGNYRKNNIIVEDYSAQKGETSVTFSDDSISNIFYRPEDMDEINFYDMAGLDTWIGGDNDSSGYYFDYEDWEDPESKIVLKSTEKNPITFRLKGKGTQEDPYLISSESDWRDMTTSTDKYYKLTKDLNFETKKFYEMGNNNNKVTGITLDGGAKTISNVTINAREKNYVGIFGYVSGATIYGLQLDNINVTGNNYVGGLVGTSTGSTIKEIVASNLNVTGNSYVAGIGGDGQSSSTCKNMIARSVVVAGNDKNYTGTVFVYFTTSSIIVEDYTVSNGDSYIKANDDSASNRYYKPEDKNDINFYDSAGLDTWIGGDNDSSGYYFDYEDWTNPNSIVGLKSVEENPIEFDLQGNGTEEDPYLISNEEDWKKMTSRTAITDKYYKLTNDLDFSSKKFYQMGNGDKMVSNITFEGGAKFISNVTIKSRKKDYVGIFGYASNSTIYGLNLRNINVVGNDSVGALVGRGKGGSIKEISLNGGTIESESTSTDSRAGGIMSTFVTGYEVEISDILIKNANVTGLGGTYGVSKNSVSNSIVENANISGNSTGVITGNTLKNGYYSNLVTVNNTKKTDGFDATYIDDLGYYDGKVETSDDGDKNNSGYYFDYVNSLHGIYVVEAKETESDPDNEDYHDDRVPVITKVNDQCEDKTPPICRLISIRVLGNGFTAQFTCSDDVQVKAVRSLYDHDPYNGQYDSKEFDNIGTQKNPTITDNGKVNTVKTTWTPYTTPDNPPVSGVCYYFSYGAQDTCNNWVVYHTNRCYSY